MGKAGGILAGIAEGGFRAMGDIVQGNIDERKARALRKKEENYLKLKHQYDMELQKNQQGFVASEREADQRFDQELLSKEATMPGAKEKDVKFLTETFGMPIEDVKNMYMTKGGVKGENLFNTLVKELVMRATEMGKPITEDLVKEIKNTAISMSGYNPGGNISSGNNLDELLEGVSALGKNEPKIKSTAPGILSDSGYDRMVPQKAFDQSIEKKLNRYYQ